MKKLFYKISLLLVVLATVSCEEDTINYPIDGGKTAYLFINPSSSLAVDASDPSSVEVEVGVTTRSNVDRTFSVEIDPLSTALPAEYSLGTAVIPAGEFNGKLVVTGNFAALQDNVTSILILNLVETDSESTVVGKTSHTISIFKFCPTDLAGSYSVTTTYGFHDFLPSYATNTVNVEITAEAQANRYKVADFSGGLYSTGPYATAYGTGTPANASRRDLIFSVNCGVISWTGESDPYGPIVPTTGAVNSYNPSTGVLTISWTASGFGERGVSVYTPL